jgi:hypothetical protein
VFDATPPPPFPGPGIQLVKALPRASPLPPWVSGGVRAILRELPGAVVVVEDTAPTLPALPAQRKILGGRWKYFTPGLPSPLAMATPVPAWMDPSVIRSGGNVVHKIYSFGGLSD